ARPHRSQKGRRVAPVIGAGPGGGSAQAPAARGGGGGQPRDRLARRGLRRRAAGRVRRVLQPRAGQHVHQRGRARVRQGAAPQEPQPRRRRPVHQAGHPAGPDDAVQLPPEGREREPADVHPGRAPADDRADPRPPPAAEGQRDPRGPARAEAGRGRQARRQHGADEPRGHQGGRARPRAPPVRHRLPDVREGRRRRHCGGDPQPRRPLDGEGDHGGARGRGPGPRRADPPAHVRVRGHPARQRQGHPIRPQGSGQRGTVPRPQDGEPGTQRQDLQEHVRAGRPAHPGRHAVHGPGARQRRRAGPAEDRRHRPPPRRRRRDHHRRPRRREGNGGL
ncbi:MAG: Flagellar motor switch protein FliG, partial [uncultured Phycisphaerae bacterium]